MTIEDLWKKIQEKRGRIIYIGPILFFVFLYGSNIVYEIFGENANVVWIIAIFIVSVIVIGFFMFKLLKKRKINEKIKEKTIRVRKKQIAQKKKLEIEAVEKVKNMLKVSQRIKIDSVKDAVGRDTRIFEENIWDWAYEFGFKIDGDYIVVENADIDGFIKKLDKQFELWKNRKKN